MDPLEPRDGTAPGLTRPAGLAFYLADELRAELLHRAEGGIVITVTFMPGEGRGEVGWVIQGDQHRAIGYMVEVVWRMLAQGAAERA
jgi:hypothetical protein